MTPTTPLSADPVDPVVDGGPLRLAVVGAGRWGRLHAAKLAALPAVELVAVVDRDARRAAALAARYGVRTLHDVERVSTGVDGPIHGAVVAVDLPQLAPVTARLLEGGLHVLAEKPLALNVGDARALVELAARRRRVLATGFVERFIVPDARGRRLVTRRVGAARAQTPLGLDWLVHDLDHALRCLGPDLRLLDAQICDERARLRLAGGGREARLTVQRRARPPWRRLWLDGRRIDLTAGRDPLAAELAAFCRVLRGGDGGPLARGVDAWRVLAVLDQLVAARPAA